MAVVARGDGEGDSGVGIVAQHSDVTGRTRVRSTSAMRTTMLMPIVMIELVANNVGGGRNATTNTQHSGKSNTDHINSANSMVIIVKARTRSTSTQVTVTPTIS